MGSALSTTVTVNTIRTIITSTPITIITIHTIITIITLNTTTLRLIAIFRMPVSSNNWSPPHRSQITAAAVPPGGAGVESAHAAGGLRGRDRRAQSLSDGGWCDFVFPRMTLLTHISLCPGPSTSQQSAQCRPR
jgi:hypothetical protein